MNLRLHLAIRVALLAVVLSSCVGTPPPTVEEMQAYDEAVALESTDPKEAARRFEAFLKEHQRSSLAESAAARRARLAQGAGDRAKAVFWLRWLVDNYPKGEQSDSARVELARLSYQAGDRETSHWAIEGVRVRRLSAEQKRTFYRMRAELADDRVERVRWLATARAAAIDAEVQEQSLELIDAEIHQVVDALSALELLRAADMLGSDPPAGRVALRLAELNMDAGDYDAAAGELRSASRFQIGEGERLLLDELSMRMDLYESGRGIDELLPRFESLAEQSLPSTEGAAGVLGVVLPLSGPYASYGEESLRGVLLAAGVFDAIALSDSIDWEQASNERVSLEAGRGAAGGDGEEREGRVRVLIRDSGGDPGRASAAVRALAEEDNLVAIVGPLRAKESEAAARAAEDAEIPLIALTTREDVPRDRPNVFRLRTTPADELRYLVDYAFEQQGARRFAVLYPEDGYGRGMRDHFWRMVEDRDGFVVGVSSYDPNATDFGDAIRRMIGYELLTRSERGALVEREAFLRRGRRLPSEHAALAREIAAELIGPESEPLPPIVDFDALFIPDGYGKIGLIAPQLAFNGLVGVQLLGPGDWYHPDLIEIAQEHVSGAVISALFDPNSRFPFVATFVDDYRAAFAAEPDAYSAHAYDAANLVLVQLAKGRRSREEVRKGIVRTHSYPGASGVISLSPDGNARKRPFLLRVNGSQMAPLD
jgi:ABC-type branched-subunit amino acid transport system substrate-binding protein/predicted negative regulator of RcsB-dependent stress response